jgi:hypothetical protein
MGALSMSLRSVIAPAQDANGQRIQREIGNRLAVGATRDSMA